MTEASLSKQLTGSSRQGRTPYYHLVPKDVTENLRFRRTVVEEGHKSRKAAHEFWMMCSRDILFYLNVFGWIYEPRTPAVLPFVTYPFQDQAILEMDAAVGDHDLCVKKSRDNTASWDMLSVFEWRWQFHPMQSFLLVSRTEDLVDKADDPDSLFWKVLFLIEKQPSWLRPRFTRSMLRLKNNDNGSTINGASTTGNVGRGGRRTAVGVDEYAAFRTEDGYRALYATQAVTKSRIWNSTPQGSGNAYYDVAHDPNVRQLVLHWSEHPEKAKGLYRVVEGKAEVLDKDYEYPEDFQFVNTPGGWKGLRSPWYDKECLRTPIPQLIAQELDMDFLGSAFQFFDKEMLDFHESIYVQPPYLVGELDFDKESADPDKFLKDAGQKRLALWLHLDASGKPPQDRRYVIGVDISAGTGASNSCLTIADTTTGEKVGAFTSPQIAPHEIAKYAAALGRWFCDKTGNAALVIAESNGGLNRQFHKSLFNLGYGSIFYRKNEQSISGKVSKVPGWGSTKDNKRELLEEYKRALSAGEFINRCQEAVAECKEYVYFPDKQVGHARSRSVIDPSGAGDNHGDRVIADALCWRGMRDRKNVEVSEELHVPVGSLAWRIQEEEKARAVTAAW